MALLLSIDGGGALGAGPARFLAQAESEYGDLGETALCGTSAGGLLVLLRATGLSWREIEEIWTAEVGRIFAPPPIWWRLDPTRPKYQSKGLEQACAKWLNRPCRQALTPFFVPAFDFALGRPKVFDWRESNFTMAEVALATTAAPTYFQPRQNRFVDGGLVANNPSLIGLLGSVNQGLASIEDTKLLSLSTSGNFWSDPEIGRRTNAISWLKPLISAMIGGNEERSEFLTSELLGNRHVRVVPNCMKDYQLDELAALPEFRKLWDRAFQYHRDDLNRLLGVKNG